MDTIINTLFIIILALLIMLIKTENSNVIKTIYICMACLILLVLYLGF